ncbi:GumC family protein [Gracilimonas halophila]|uniref:GumC family protein n=1 Tax=Gracilimonas halophila TaxID=1834464 RepID=A0ABW5JFZ6_9BACT
MDSQSDKETKNNAMFFLRLVISNWKLLFGIYAIVGILTVIILLVIPKWYKSDATIVILDENKTSLSSLMSEFSSLGLNFAGGGEVATYIEYLHTNKMYDRLNEEFGLAEVYKAEYREDVYEEIFENLIVTDNENKTFTISYIYKEDPEKAAEIVDFLYQELDKIALEVDKAEASNFRTYIENYYRDIQNNLNADEDSLARFQTRTGILDLEAQLGVTISGLAELEKERISLEIERNYVENAFQNPSRINEIESRIKAITDKIEQLKSTQNNTFVALDYIPEQGADFLRLRRDILVGEKVSEFLRLQYEQALLDEQKINSNLYLVDPPSVPEKRYKPQRTRILFIVMFFTVLLSLFYIRADLFYKNNQQALKELL